MTDFQSPPQATSSPSAPAQLSQPGSPEAATPGWERKFIEKLAGEALMEQRRKRRWGIFFKLLGFAYVGIIFGSLMINWSGSVAPVEKHVGVVELDGIIAPGTSASAERINQSLNAAFESPDTVGVLLRINSPGGSPVQAGIIHDEILRLRDKFPNKPLFAVVEEVCASGGYYVAAAANKIFVDKASLVGSIGVMLNGFGFTEAMEKLGVERRLITAGENKGFLDPFSQQDPYQAEFARQMAEEIHTQFIDVVKKGRGERLKNKPELFSGLVWTGQSSVELGLADGLGSLESVARLELKNENLLNYTYQESFAERFAKRVGVTFGQSVVNAVRAPMAW